MRRRVLYLLVAALSVTACFEAPTDRGDISFSAVDGASTRALMNDAALKTSGNKLKVFDELTGFSGRASWMGADNLYINDEIVYAGNPVWNYVSGRSYPWTANGTHKFFSWLSYDNTLSMTDAQFCGASFNNSTKVLSIPQKEMTTSTPLYDFMYSDVVSLAAADHTPGSSVNLQMHHLFTALNISVKNTSGNTILLRRVTLSGMKNKRSATLDFSGDTVAVATANLAATDVVLYESDDPAGTVYPHQDTSLTLTDFIQMWPQSYVELSGATIVVEYNIRDSHDQVSDDLTASIILDRQNVFKTNSVGMDAGTKYSFQLQFKKSTIDIYTSVLPWEYEAYDWDYSERSISARSGTERDGVLVFYRRNPNPGPNEDEFSVVPTADEWSAKTLRFTTRNEVMKGRFYLESPASGRWRVTAYPMSAAQYFIITPTAGDIDVLHNNGMAEFTVSVNPDLSPSSTQTLYFDIAIYFNGEWHDANSEFNRKNIKLVLDAN